MRTHVFIAIGLLCVTTPASAQSGGEIDLQAFRPAMDSRGFITLDSSQVLGHGDLSFGLVTNWGHGLLRLEQDDASYEVTDMVSPTLVAAVGMRVFGAELEFGASAPFSIMNGDRGPDSNGGTPNDPNDDNRYRIEGQGLGNVGVHLKWRLANTSRGARVGLAVVASVQLPTASSTTAWIGDGTVTPRIGLVVEREFGPLRIGASGGFRFRSRTLAFEDVAADGPMTGQRVEVGSTLPFGAAVSYAVSPQKMDLVGEVRGEIPLSGVNYLPAEASVAVKLYLARNSFLLLGGGVGLAPSQGGNPDTRAFLGIIFEPSVGDRDGDGIKDDLDRCPDDPEDMDDFEDADGCPELDNDRDRIPDVDDQCPNEPEDRDGDRDDDGCPDADHFDRDGDGIVDVDDECPDDPEDMDEFEDTDGCPDLDNDDDHILDVDDLCPNDPEDVDSFEDSDGCPDLDNDRDRIPDTLDLCRGKDGEDRKETAETWNNFEDDDGCPDRGTTYFDDGVMVVLKKIHFEYNSTAIKPVSYPILDAVAKTLELNPEVRRIEVQGHTDERGSEQYNLTLSQGRSESVVAYLKGKGIDGGRLVPVGYGESTPIDKGHGQRAWARNRRVEFIILSRAAQP